MHGASSRFIESTAGERIILLFPIHSFNTLTYETRRLNFLLPFHSHECHFCVPQRKHNVLRADHTTRVKCVATPSVRPLGHSHHHPLSPPSHSFHQDPHTNRPPLSSRRMPDWGSYRCSHGILVTRSNATTHIVAH